MLRDGIVGLCALALLGGCAASQQARNVETSGFLGDDYALLRTGKADEALWFTAIPMRTGRPTTRSSSTR
jgi:hypothetical protein